MRTETWRIAGMTCAACSAAVERAVRPLPGVSAANVNLATEKLTVTYDPDQTTPEQIAAAVAEAGYSAAPDQNRKEVTIPIEGMT